MDTVPEARETAIDDFQTLNHSFLSFPPVVGTEEFTTPNTETIPPSKLGSSDILKRPRSAYNFFSQSMFSKLKGKNPGKTSNEVVKEVVSSKQTYVVVGNHVE